MECRFEVGQSVECVNDLPSFPGGIGMGDDLSGLKSGEIYKIRDIKFNKVEVFKM